jgi:glycosyltransferase involved in cell wall biosynthesis
MTGEYFPVRIVIPCRNADTTIETCLAAIYQSQFIRYEVVIVDDGGNTILNSLQDKYSFLLIRSQGSVGAGAARNLGARGFRGALLVFIDADVELVHPETVSLLLQPLICNEAVATVGCYSRPHQKNFFETYKQLYLAYTYSTKIGELKNSFWTALCAVQREWFDIIGGFEECFAGAGPEDIKFGIECTKRGGKIRAVPEALGYHNASMNFFGLLYNDLRKGCEDVYTHWRHRIPLTNNRHVDRSDIFAVAFACMVLFFLGFSFVFGILPLLLCGSIYLFFRERLLRKAFFRKGLLFFFLSVFLSFILDIIRALAIIIGTHLYVIDVVSRGKMKPFLKK